MLKSISIRNYALIEKLDITLDNGFTTITGETGAGKSILLGAIGLMLGNRADIGVLFHNEKKCVVEGSFDISKYGLRSLFENNDVDYSDITVIRREILPQEKTRAFINDTPVQVSILKEIGTRLVDIHSQNQNLLLTDRSFYMQILDSTCSNKPILQEYSCIYSQYKRLVKEFNELNQLNNKSAADLEYFKFQFEELDNAKLVSGQQESLEEEQNLLQHTEEIIGLLSLINVSLSTQDGNILSQIATIRNPLHTLAKYVPKAEEYAERFEIAYAEIKDIAAELENYAETIDYNPVKLQSINDRLDLIYRLQKKHNALTIDELLQVKEDLEFKLNAISNHDEMLKKIEEQLVSTKDKLKVFADKMHKNRESIIVKIEKHIVEMLDYLGMPNSKLKIELIQTEDFTAHGIDKVEFMFTANKQIELQPLAKVASGGEKSRLMLSFKNLISSSISLPTIILDEIDTGISGEIANKMGKIMQNMAKNMQVISITHLPQIAAKSSRQFKVYKYDTDSATKTEIKQLTDNERIEEIAKMLSGENVTQSAISNAKELLLME